MENWKTRAAGQSQLHVSQWAAHEWVKQQPPGTQVKVYKRGPTGWRLHETLTAGQQRG